MKDTLLQSLDCVRLYVPNLEQALAFYRDHLGLSVAWRSKEAIGLRLPQTDAELVLQTEHPGLEIDFLVESADRAAREVEQAGGKVMVQPFDIQIGRCVVVRDPWDNELVLLDMSKGQLLTDNDGNILGNANP
jgi:predicted enzyme related to lactoylglutathione lyase